MRKSTAFCPSYITGIFTVGNGDAAGAGFSLDKGMTTTVSETSGMPTIKINNKQSAAPVSWNVLKKYEERGGEVGGISITHKAEMPIGFGCGMSAAGAVSLALALNELLGAGLKFSECVGMAHDAEVECGTGLSGADAAALGGIVARRSLQSGPVKLPFEEKKIHLAFFSAIETASIIRDPNWKTKVNREGKRKLGELFREKCWEKFVFCSREFALASGLGKWCEKNMSENPRAGMAMVGRTLFSDSKLALPGADFKGMLAKTCGRGAEVV